MKNKRDSIRKKLLLALVNSIAFAGVCLLVFSGFLILASDYMPFAIFFNQHIFLFILIYLILFSGLTFGCFYFLIGKKIKYIEMIIGRINTIGAGVLADDLIVHGDDELGRMAHSINLMVSQIKKSKEEELRLERYKMDLMTSLSHDLRTPLTSVTGYLDLISRLEKEELEKSKSYSQLALKQCETLKHLLEALFEYTKLNHQDYILNPSRFSLGELLEQVIIMFMPALEKADMIYELKMPEVKIMVLADPALIKRVFENLISNAIKYGKDGRKIEIVLKQENNVVSVQVTNYGTQIPDKDLPFLFERFYQGETQYKKGEGGAGLGLAIVKSILSLHHGEIHVFSSIDQTTFEVQLKA